MTKHLRIPALILAGLMLLTLAGCGGAAEDDRQIIRIGHNQSTSHPTNVEMMRLLGGSATPMGFGEVYTALQSKVIDGAENNERALTGNGHGDVGKYYSYDMHQMIPDILIGNAVFFAKRKDYHGALGKYS